MCELALVLLAALFVAKVVELVVRRRAQMRVPRASYGLSFVYLA